MPDFSIEKSIKTHNYIFGVDEAGRGPWSGPVVAACVCWKNLNIPLKLQEQINDSKKLSHKKREELYEEIMSSEHALVGIGQASVEEIDRLNILQATFLAMQRALDSVKSEKEYVLIDGNRIPPKLTYPSQAVIKGDSISLSIASASIIAKVFRDRIMLKLSSEYPVYGWDKNAGYGTKEHIEALKKFGITPYHRKSYRPIKEFLMLENS